MQHVLMYSATSGAAVTENDTAAISDPAVVKQNGHFLLPTPMQLLYSLAIGATILRARLNSPTLRRVLLPYLWPLQASALPGNDPNVADYREFPFTLPANEEIECDITNNAAELDSVALFLQIAKIPVPAGAQIFTQRCTATVAGVAGAWANGALTFGQTLPAGTYGIFGIQVQSATCIAARLIIPGYTWRPGCVGGAVIGNRPPFAGRKAPTGQMGAFSSLTLPSLEIFCTGADASQVVHLDIAQLSSSVNFPGPQT